MGVGNTQDHPETGDQPIRDTTAAVLLIPYLASPLSIRTRRSRLSGYNVT